MWRSRVRFFQGMVRFITFFSFFTFLLPISPALAKKPIQCFEIQQSCPAFQSFRKKTNLGNVIVKEGNSYSIIQKSKKGTHYRVRIEGIERQERWIESRCGIKTNQCGNSKSGISVAKPISSNSKKGKAKSGQYLLALSWTTTFVSRGQKRKNADR